MATLPFRFAICNETFGDWELKKAVDYAVAAGYQGWEVAPFMLADRIEEFTAAQRAGYAAEVRAAGLEVIGLHWLLAKTSGYHLTSPDPNVRKATSEYLGSLARLCADLGGSIMVLGSPQQRNILPGLTSQQAFESAIEVLESAIPVLEETGVKIALEPLGPQETNFLNTAAEARRLYERLGSKSIGLHLDMKAMSTEEIPIPDLIEGNQDWLLHFHANDPNKLGPGMGSLEVEPAMASLVKIGYSGWVSVEVFDYSPGAEVLADQSIANLRAACEAV